MTCVVGVVGENGVLLAGDSQSTGENSMRNRIDAKTFKIFDTVAVAYCGSGRFGQILTHWLEDLLEEPPLGMDEQYWAIRLFIPSLTDVLEAHGHLHRYEATEVVELGDSAFLLAVRNRVFCVEPDMQVSEDELPFSSLGSGEDVAVGAMLGMAGHGEYAIDDRKLDAIARAGIKAATKITPYVGGKITTVRTVTYSPAEKALARKVLA